MKKKFYLLFALAALALNVLAQKNVKTITVNGVSFDMVLVKGGTFTMGCNEEKDGDCDTDEVPAHSVTLDDYRISKFEVTQELWKAVMGKEITQNGGWTEEYGKGDNYPAYKISGVDCQKFIAKLNKLTGRKFSLPTEAEWEYAARGGRKNVGNIYSGDMEIDSVAWYIDNSEGSAHPVGSKAPNELGIYDMSGNVWEWCSDWFCAYKRDSQTNPKGAAKGNERVMRGGSWNFSSWNCRVTYREYDAVENNSFNYGLRLVLR